MNQIVFILLLALISSHFILEKHKKTGSRNNLILISSLLVTAWTTRSIEPLGQFELGKVPGEKNRSSLDVEIGQRFIRIS